jgi:tetratricopeptide (TPR) repeat protein
MSPRSKLLLAAALSALVACGGAHGAAMDRGDKYAEAGMWDKAAAEYEQALRLDPDDADTAIKLKNARAKISAERLSRGKSLMERGEIEAGLAAIQEAVRLDPDSAAAQRALTDGNAAALARAEALLEGPHPARALELTTLVLAGSPRDVRARRADRRIREALADGAYARAEELAAAGKRGNALVEYAAAASYVPDHRDARLRIAELKQALRKELTFTVVLESYAAEPRASELAGALSPDLLAQAFDERLPLRVQREAPRGKDGGVRGVRLVSRFDGYRFTPRRESERRTCSYVCRTEMRPNPAHQGAEQSVASAERRLAQVDEDVARRQKDVDRYQQEVGRYQQEVDRAEQEADRRRADLDRCRERAAKDTSSSSSTPCSSEESSLRSAQSTLDSARSRLSSPQGYLASARQDLARANDSRDGARRDQERATETMRSTPRDVEVPVSCDYDYDVAVHTLSAAVTARISVENLEEATKVLVDEPFVYRVQHRAESFPAQPGRCAEIARGQPLRLPSEKQVRQALVDKTIAGLREKVLATYDRYRQRFLADARREEAAGLADEAVEAYVRYVLTGSKSIDPKDQKQIGEFLARARGFGKLDQLGSL